MYKIIIDKNVYKFLEKNKWKNIIYKFEDTLNILRQSPYINNLDKKRLVWFKNRYRLRIWKYRLLYEIKENELIIVLIDIWSRWVIYK